MIKRFISTCLIIFSGANLLNAQDIYRLKYKISAGNNAPVYDAYFSLSADGTGFVRIKSEQGQTPVAEMSFEEEYARNQNGESDLNYLIYRGRNPRTVKGNNVKADSVNFWFKINADNLYDPWAVTPSSSGTPPSQSNIINTQFLKGTELNNKKDIVLSFFADTSLYYKSLFGPRSKGGMLSPDERRNTRMYMVVVASTNDPKLKPNCLIDARKVISTFSDIAGNVLGLPSGNIRIDSVYGDRYNRASVQAALRRISPGSNDLVIFYYSGHGFHDNNSPKKQFPFFDLRDPLKELKYNDLKTEVLNVRDIYDTIIKKGARFNLVLSDCCNDTVAAPKKKGTAPPGKKGLSKTNFDNVKALFMNKQQVNLLMTAASVNEEAIVTPSFNSYFTYFFLQSLNTYLSPEKVAPTWAQVLSAAQTSTIRQVNGLCNGKTNCSYKQIPRILVPGIN